MKPQHIFNSNYQCDENHKAPRMETGPLRVNNDWTGYFIRGDTACLLAHTASQIETILEENAPELMKDYKILFKMLLNQVKCFSECDESNFREK